MMARLALPLIFGLAFLAGTPNVANRSGAAGIVLAQAPAAPPAAVEPSPPAGGAPAIEATPAIESPPAPAPPPAAQPPAPVAPPAAAEEKDKAPPPKSAERPAKELFAAKRLPSLGAAVSIGYYPKGCITGAVALPTTGSNWQVMRLSRNRNWGHPNLVRFVEKFAKRTAKATGWKGILVGDLSQPRGGPMLTGHLSHQIGLDVDIWFMPMPDRVLSKEEREEISAINVVNADWTDVNRETWTPQHMAFIKAATDSPEVERVLVNAAIKKELCKVAGGDRKWLAKVRPFYAHHDHIHVRLRCPEGDTVCKKQPPIGGDEDCGKGLDWWFSEKARTPRKPPAVVKHMMLADLPPACKAVLDAP